MKDFKDKVVVITGGATGIGKAMADKFGAEGAVIITSRRENRLQEAIKVFERYVPHFDGDQKYDSRWLASQMVQ